MATEESEKQAAEIARIASGLPDFVRQLRSKGWSIDVGQIIAAQQILLSFVSNRLQSDSVLDIHPYLGGLFCKSASQQGEFRQLWQQWCQCYLVAQRVSQFDSTTINRGSHGLVAKEQSSSQPLQKSVGVIKRIFYFPLYAAGAVFVAGVYIGKMLYSIVLALWRRNRTAFLLLCTLLIVFGSFSPLDWLPKLVSAHWVIIAGAAGIGFLGYLVIILVVRSGLLLQQADELHLIKLLTCRGFAKISLRATRSDFVALLTQRQFAHVDLDIEATVKKSADSGGMCVPVYRVRTRHGEHTFLLEFRSSTDVLGCLAEKYVRAISAFGSGVDVYYLHSSLGMCTHHRQNGPGRHLDSVLTNRVIDSVNIFADGYALINPLSGILRPWMNLIGQCVSRNVFKQPDSYDADQALINQLNALDISTRMLVWSRLIEPRTTVAQLAFGELPKDGTHAKYVSQHALPSQLESMIIAYGGSNTKPSTLQVKEMTSRVRAFLGESGYTLLTMCAIYPRLEVHLLSGLYSKIPQLAAKLLSGTANARFRFLQPKATSYHLDEFEWTSREFDKLVVLPWFRQGCLPHWLREIMLDEMPEEPRLVGQEWYLKLAYDLLICRNGTRNAVLDEMRELTWRERVKLRVAISGLRLWPDQYCSFNDRLLLEFVDRSFSGNLGRYIRNSHRRKEELRELAIKEKATLESAPNNQVRRVQSKDSLEDDLANRLSGEGANISIGDAIAKSQTHLLKLQKREGYWIGELMVDSTLVSDTVAYHHWNGKVDPEWQRKAVNHILAMQLPDGGWNTYYGGPAEVNATIKAYLALKLAGLTLTDPRMLHAQEMALNLGGVPRMSTFSKLYLALLGLFPWKHVPTIPCEVILIGKWFYVDFNELSSWSRSMLVPLAIISHFKPTRPLKINLNELYPAGIHERDLALVYDPDRFTWRNFFLWLDKLHKFAELWAQAGIHPFRKRALKKAEQWMIERFEGSDGLAAIFPPMLNSLIALKALGYPDDHPQVVRAERELKKLEHETADSVRIEPCLSPVWDTAIVAICLHESGVPSHHPALEQCAEWLMTKEIRFRGDWQYSNPVNIEPSGWAFQYENKWSPDVDNTAMVLLALRKLPTVNPEKRDECFRRGLNWLLAFQCKDGGWAAFDKDRTKGILEKVPFADHNAMLDPECVDITARVLELLGYANFNLDHPQVQKALDYIRGQQEADGSWYGRWGVNYIYGSCQVLRGLRALKVDMKQTWVLKARDWLESVQHGDGGWGERCNTYDDPVYKGHGPSTASQTAWAIVGLCAFEDPDRPSLKRGINYLLHTQNLDGSWTENETTCTGFPKVFYTKCDLYRNAWPLLALASYGELRRRSGSGMEEAIRTQEQFTSRARSHEIGSPLSNS